MEFKTYLNSLRLKGNLAYEYNPFHNYQTNEDLWLVDNKYYVPKGKAVNLNNGEILNNKGDENNEKWVDKYGNIIEDNNIIGKPSKENPADIKKGSLMDLDTKNFNFDLNHPVDIEIQPSYDGSVNLILNDDKNIPRIINSRFSVREKNTYEIVDRIGENDTNIYSSDNFDKDTSLYFQYESNPIIEYKGLINGVLPVGLYCFYFTYADSDDNESDFIAESGLIPVFIGSDKDPYSMDGGIKNQITNKGIKLKLTNIDASYNYLKVYYVRYFADYLLNRVYECKKIYLKYPVNSNKLILQITGNENTEDIDANILNISRFNPKSILTLAQCKNMLFFGNIVKNTDNYKELQDCALRIIPSILRSTLSDVNTKYSDSNNEFGYYNSYNIYNKVGYFSQEYYRFGVVFIYLNGTLSNVYNTLGCELLENNSIEYIGQLYENDSPIFLKRNYISVDDFGWVINDGLFNTNKRLNARGVCKINVTKLADNEILGIKFNVPDKVKEFLKELGIRGLFFVRLKRIPNLIALCYLLPMDELLEAPILKVGDSYKTECFISNRFYGKKWVSTSPPIVKKVDEGGLLTNDYESRLLDYGTLTNKVSTNAYAGICPDFLLDLSYYNQIFNGAKFKLERITNGKTLERDEGYRYYRLKNGDIIAPENISNNVTICSVTENVSSVALQNKVYKLEIGAATEAIRFKYAQVDNGTYTAGDENKDKVNKASNIVRGIYSPYLAIYSSSELKTGELYNIYQENFLDDEQLYLNRMNSSEPFYAISDRYNFELLDNDTLFYRGDCYLNTFTYRLNRNFNDSSLPNNDQIIDLESWRNNYDAFDSSKWEKISRSDVNAIQLGSWITIKVRSYMNYALRSEDYSYVAETALMGSPRSFYPRKQMMWIGNHKMPDSYLYNDAYRASLGFKCYFTLQDINYIKNAFSNRILYSSIAIQDSFKNNYRESLSTYYRDYSTEYGGITKLVPFEGYLLVVLEHAIGVAVINERILAGQSDGEPVFINTQNVLPEELTIITDTYGTLWSESVVKSETGYVYGVDTVAKKIWRVKGQLLEILSDFKVNKFLIDNISLGERELYPIIGLKNVKTHYNNNKKDIMFTFYDDIYLDEEKAWNLCYNELLGLFITFYSWIPSYSENIDTQFFTFNRNISKELTLLNMSNYNIESNTGILVDNPVLYSDIEEVFRKENDFTTKIFYRVLNQDILTLKNEDGTTTTLISSDGTIDTSMVKFKFEKDHWGNWKLFEYDKDSLELPRDDNGNSKLSLVLNLDNREYKYAEILKNMKDKNLKTLILYISAVLDDKAKGYVNSIYLKSLAIAVTFKDIVDNPNLKEEDYEKPNLTTDFYLHGLAGIFDVKESLYPTYWYGEFHPFEFEFVVNDKIGQLKLFENLIIISNKAEPLSFHFEIEGDNYEFSSDKRTMYFRLEFTKKLYQELGSDMIYDRKFTDIVSKKKSLEQYYRGGTDINTGRKYSDYPIKGSDRVYPIESTGLVQLVKSTIFPLYYEKIDTYNDIYYKYESMKNPTNYDFKNLSGSEIKWDRDLNLFNIVTHIKNNQIDLVGRLRGNSRYKEGKWNIQIPSIIFNLKNEEEWKTSYEGINIPPIVINSSNIPSTLEDNYITPSKLPSIYLNGEYNWQDAIDSLEWTYRKEAVIRDKWIKIRIRYSGKNLAIIHSLITLYNISYS